MAEHDVQNGAGSSGAYEPLVQAARDGCATSLGELTERCRQYLLQVARRELNGNLRVKVAPSDLVQQTLVQAHRLVGGFRGETEAEFQAWLTQILVNAARGTARQFQQTAKRNVRREVSLDSPEVDGGPKALIDNIESPSKHAIANERMQAMALALQRLPPLYRQVIELRNLKLLPFAEIGRQLSRSPEAARAAWMRAVERLRAETHGSDESL